MKRGAARPVRAGVVMAAVVLVGYVVGAQATGAVGGMVLAIALAAGVSVAIFGRGIRITDRGG